VHVPFISILLLPKPHVVYERPHGGRIDGNQHTMHRLCRPVDVPQRNSKAWSMGSAEWLFAP
jgi:hypothetical protein